MPNRTNLQCSVQTGNLRWRRRTACLLQSKYDWSLDLLGNERLTVSLLSGLSDGGGHTLRLPRDPEESWTVGLAMGKMAATSDTLTKATSFPLPYSMGWLNLYLLSWKKIHSSIQLRLRWIRSQASPTFALR